MSSSAASEAEAHSAASAATADAFFSCPSGSWGSTDPTNGREPGEASRARQPSWESSSVPELPALGEETAWMADITSQPTKLDVGSEGFKPASPPMDQPRSPPADEKFADPFGLAHDVGGVGDSEGSKRGIDSDDAFPEPMLSSESDFPTITTPGNPRADLDMAPWPTSSVPPPPPQARAEYVSGPAYANGPRFQPAGPGNAAVPPAPQAASAPGTIRLAPTHKLVHGPARPAPGSRSRPPPPQLARSLKTGGGRPSPRPTPKPRTPRAGRKAKRDGRQTGKTQTISYGEMLAKLPANPDAQGLLSLFLRDELRSLLKRNGISYHKPGRANLMKSKIEMAADLMELMEKGLKTAEQVAKELASGGGDESPRGRKASERTRGAAAAGRERAGQALPEAKRAKASEAAA